MSLQRIKVRLSGEAAFDHLLELIAITVRRYGIVARPSLEDSWIAGARDVLVLESDLTLEQLLQLLACVPDGEVMFQTAQYENDFTGERDLDRCGYWGDKSMA